jgi:hypothetical protein
MNRPLTARIDYSNVSSGTCVLIQSTLRLSPEGQKVAEVGPGIAGGLGSLRVHQLQVELLVLELSGVIPGFMRVRPREEEHCNAYKQYRGNSLARA